MPDELSRQYCNLSSVNDLKAAILHKRAAIQQEAQVSDTKNYITFGNLQKYVCKSFILPLFILIYLV